jgi:predicted amidophosphoribosyltransferase
VEQINTTGYTVRLDNKFVGFLNLFPNSNTSDVSLFEEPLKTTGENIQGSKIFNVFDKENKKIGVLKLKFKAKALVLNELNLTYKANGYLGSIDRNMLNNKEKNIQKLYGNWDTGFALDIHTLNSDYLGQDEHGHDKFKTVRSKMGELVYQLKYQENQSAVTEIVSIILSSGSFNKIEAIIPIPPSNLTRKYQPVFIIATELAEKLNKKVYLDALNKTIGSKELKNIEDIQEREQALKNSMSINLKYPLTNKTVLLLDDIYRSGATLRVATDLLKSKAGVKCVYVLTMTKTRSNR